MLAERLQLRHFHSTRFQHDARPTTASDKHLSTLALLIAACHAGGRGVRVRRSRCYPAMPLV
jgi:hypothetical protein